MAAGAVTTTSVADSVPTEFIAEVRLKTKQGAVMRGLVDTHTLPEGEGGIYEITELTRAIAYALTEGVDMTQAQEITDSSLEVTPGEVGAQIVRTDLADRQVTKRANLPRLLGETLGNAIITKEDIDLLAQVDAAATALGSAGVSLTAGYIMAAAATIRGGGQASGLIAGGTPEPGPDPINAIFTDNQFHNVAKQFTVETHTYNESVKDLLGTAFIKRIGGANVYIDNNLGKDASDDAKGGVFSKKALVFVRFGGGPNMEPERDASGRWTEMNIVEVYGTGLWKDAWLREMLFDGAAPTS